MVEVVAAMVLLSIILSSVMVLMNRYVDSVIDMQLREQAFELARGNMELLLAETKLSDITEFGTSEINPDIEWETLVEPAAALLPVIGRGIGRIRQFRAPGVHPAQHLNLRRHSQLPQVCQSRTSICRASATTLAAYTSNGT